MKNILIFCCVVALAGCAHTGSEWVPIVDLKAGQQEAYTTDLPACQSYARQTMSTGQSAATGAVAGAIFGALVGAAFGVNRGEMAKLGAISGGVGGATSGEVSQRVIIIKCLVGRGYSVLN